MICIQANRLDSEVCTSVRARQEADERALRGLETEAGDQLYSLENPSAHCACCIATLPNWSRHTMRL